MRDGMLVLPSQDRFWTPLAGIARHSEWNKKPGFYEVIALVDAMTALDFFTRERYGWSHALAVVDDFGNLVRVGPWS